MEAEHKHKFKILRVEDHFLFQQIVFSCVHCFVMCIMDKTELYKVLKDEWSFNWDER